MNETQSPGDGNVGERPKLEENPKRDCGIEEEASESVERRKKLKKDEGPDHAEARVEADAAEDKGSRHSMEDAWVVLPDAWSDFPVKLRFFLGFFCLVCLFLLFQLI